MAKVLVLVGHSDGVLTDAAVTAANVIGATTDSHLVHLIAKVLTRFGDHGNPEIVSWESVMAVAASRLTGHELTYLMTRGPVAALAAANPGQAFTY